MPCYSYIFNIFILILVSIGSALFSSVMIKSNYESCRKSIDEEFATKKMIKSAYLKVFFNYTQCIYILEYLNLNWGSIMKNAFYVNTIPSGAAFKSVSFECIVNGMNSFRSIFYFCFP